MSMQISLPKTYTKRLALALLAGVLVLGSLTGSVSASTLQGAKDFLTTDELGRANVSHSITFRIPLAGHTITTTDYIRIELPNFTSVTAPTGGGGWAGTPVFGVSGNIAYVTNVTAGPDTWISVTGVTATNPSVAGQLNVNISVANDLAGTTVYDSVTITAESLKGVTTASVTIAANSASLTLSGFAAPGVLVFYEIDGSVVGTSVADGVGNFSKVLTGLFPGLRTVGIYYQDQEGFFTATVGFTQTLFSNTNHFVSNISIPPTIKVQYPTIAVGDSQTISGRATPNAQLTLFVHSHNNYQFVTSVGSNGLWSVTFDTDSYPLEVGSHSANARQVATGGYQSTDSDVVGFNVILTCSPIPADINCDGKVNLVDFSILLFYWQQTNPANPRADINGSNFVNLTDFSIMLYYWTG